MFTEIEKKIATLKKREKIMLAVTVVFCLWGIWDSFFHAPLKQKHNLLTLELSRLNTQRTAQQQTAITLKNTVTADPNLAKQKQLAELKEKYAAQQEKIMLTGKKFVPPSLMTKVLSDVLTQNNHITLIKLNTLPVTPLLNLLNPIESKEIHPIYKHGISLTFSSDFFTTLAYLKTLEALPWRFLWDSVEYTVKTYPDAEVVLRVYTLSFEEQWLDV